MNPQTAAQNESQIRQLIADSSRAIAARDLDRLMAYYDKDVITYDVKPPFQMGKDALRNTWETCLPYFPQEFAIETRDLAVTADDNVAFAHWLFRITTPEENHPAARTWMRASAGYRKQYGVWRIVHDHCSVPFDPMTSKAVLTLDA